MLGYTSLSTLKYSCHEVASKSCISTSVVHVVDVIRHPQVSLNDNSSSIICVSAEFSDSSRRRHHHIPSPSQPHMSITESFSHHQRRGPSMTTSGH
ncbi:hypothetical protein BD410DRAFT_181367 [Rickenella mellea]|uniref:Uncharacterized protein n=1 Tax=Rickenella mellea TaxID=50990 RepID=A0A4Y7PGP4_9AGAM|nr:hypothetical protein BD410DRAFT_181367 [Rickenella mellea]